MFNITIDDTTVAFPKVEVNTFQEKEMMHLYRISNKLNSSGIDGIAYINDGNVNYEYYSTLNSTVTNYNDLTNFCEGPICFQTVP